MGSFNATCGEKGCFVDSPTHGFVRVRGGRSENTALVEAVLPVIQAAGYAAMITCGTGTYANDSEVLIAPKPQKYETQGHQMDLHVTGFHQDEWLKERPVSMAMVREDVWQILLHMEVSVYGGRPLAFADFQAAGRKMLEEDRIFQKELEAITDKEERIGRLIRRDIMDDMPKDNILLGCLTSREGMSGFSLKQALKLAKQLSVSEAELEAFVDDLAETVYVEYVYSWLHGQWHPTTNSGQDGNWEKHREILSALLQIKSVHEDEER